MVVTVNSKITIGSYSFRGVNDLSIKKSVHVIVDTATLKIPGEGRVISSKQGFSHIPNNAVQTAKLFAEGDKVSIDLGYDNDLKNEFRGFVRRVNLTTPVIIEMEGYAWQLRNQNILASWKKTTVREVLERVIQGTDIVLSDDIPAITLTAYYIKNNCGLDVLDDLKKRMLLTIYFDDNVLYAGIEEGRTTANAAGVKTLAGLAETKYNIGYNCPLDQPELKQRLGKDNRIRVRLKTRGKTGKHVLYEAGDVGGAIIERIVPFTDDQNYLKEQAAAFLKKLKYDGYEGKINAFLQPFCKPGYKATIADKKFEGARAGSYFIAGTEVSFGINGGFRNVQITYRLDGVGS